jgi:multiple sugar transport system permease protein
MKLQSTRARKWLGRVAFGIGLVVVIAPFAFVFYWMVASSLKTPVQVTANPPVWVFTPTLANYREVFLKQPFFRFILNSVIIGLGATGLGLLIGLPAAYSMARYKQRFLATVVLLARMAPWVSYLVPWFIIFRKLGALDTYSALIATHLVVTLPTIVWLMVSFFEDVPIELEEAARIDGCTKWGAFLRVSIPLVRPGIATSAILALIFSWNNFLFSLVLSGPMTKTVPVAVFNFISYEEINWGGLTAAASVITVPVLVMVFFIQRHIVRGLAFGALKG